MKLAHEQINNLRRAITDLEFSLMPEEGQTALNAEDLANKQVALLEAHAALQAALPAALAASRAE